MLESLQRVAYCDLRIDDPKVIASAQPLELSTNAVPDMNRRLDLSCRQTDKSRVFSVQRYITSFSHISSKSYQTMHQQDSAPRGVPRLPFIGHLVLCDPVFSYRMLLSTTDETLLMPERDEHIASQAELLFCCCHCCIEAQLLHPAFHSEKFLTGRCMLP
jgi:hypothetical protein